MFRYLGFEKKLGCLGCLGKVLFKSQILFFPKIIPRVIFLIRCVVNSKILGAWAILTLRLSLWERLQPFLRSKGEQMFTLRFHTMSLHYSEVWKSLIYNSLKSVINFNTLKWCSYIAWMGILHWSKVVMWQCITVATLLNF